MRTVTHRVALRKTGLVGSVAALALAAAALAVLPEPDHIFYGTPTRDGEPVTAGVVSARLAGATEEIASYVMGTDPNIGNRYVLRIPIDSIDPRLVGTARTGEGIQFFLDGVPAGNSVVGERGTVHLLDVDPAGGGLPTLSIADLALYEGNSGNTAFQFTVTLSEAIAENVTFQWGTAAGTAQGGIDFIEVAPGTPGQVNAGDTTATLTVQVKGDTFEEDADTFFVNLTNVSPNAVIFDAQALGTILDDDRPPAITIADTAVVESDAGPSSVQLTLNLSRPIAQAITVAWATAPGSATAGTDYTTANGIATFAPMALSTTLGVDALGDLDDEDDETFFVNLSSPSPPALINDAQAVVTIQDDDGFLTFVEAESLAPIEALFGATGVVVSPDGLHVYVVGQYDDAIAGFSRNSTTGELTFLFSLGDGDAQGGDTIDGLDGAESVAISPDGAHVYVAAFTDGAVATFARDAGTGGLDFLGVLKDASLGGTADGLLGASSVTLSPDGEHLYVAAATDDAVAIFVRDPLPASPTFGQLTFDGTVVDGVGPVDGLDGAQWLRFSPAGNHLYVASGVDKAIAVFACNPATGELTFVEVEKDGLAGANGLDGASSVAVSVDGANVYATGPNEDAVAIFNRNDATGEITWVDMLVDGLAGIDGLDGATGVVPSFDGRYVYVNGFFDDAIVVFTRDTVTGLLSYLEIQRDGFGVIDGLARPVEIAVSGDDQHLYVAGNNEDAVVVFMRDAIAPTLPLVLVSTSHTPSVFSNDPTVDVQWSGSLDNPGGTGLDGYSFLWDASPLTNPDVLVDLAHGVDPHSTTSPPLPDGTSYFFHLRVCDLVGNCSAPAHLGPFFIDQTAPSNPTVIVSSSHPVATPTADAVIDMTWSPDAADALSLVDGFSVFFDGSPTAVCDQVKDLEEGATGASSPPLGDGTYYFHLCTRDNAGNWSATANRGPYIVEVEPPEVVEVGTVADTGDAVLVSGEVTAAPITQLVVAFSEGVSDPPGDAGVTDASNPANYPILLPGVNNIFETATCGPAAGDDSFLVPASATYDAATWTTVVRLAGPYALPASNYRLLVCGSVTPGAVSIVDLFGYPLDGDGNGTGGDPLVLPFTVETSDLLRNPNFDAGLGNWILTPATPGVFSHDPEDADLAPTSGSLLAQEIGGTLFYLASQCVAVAEGFDFVVGGQTQLVSGIGSGPTAFGQVQYYSSTNCTTGPLGAELFSSAVVGDSGGVWEAFASGSLPVPVGGRSALVSFVVEQGAAATFDASFDRLYFSLPASIFISGFESGDFSGWSVVVGAP